MLQQLGVNQTAIIQFVIYILTFTALVFLVYSPFYKAQLLREEKTKGSEDLAHEFIKKAEDLHTEYQHEARELNSKINTIFNESKNIAQKKYDESLSEAKNESQKAIEANRDKIKGAIGAASVELQKQVPQLALTITNKMLGKS